MKRKFLEDMGLEKEQVDKILDENSQDIGKAKGDLEKVQADLATAQQEVTTLKAQVADRDGQLETLKNSTDDVEAMKQQIATLQADNKAKDEVHAAEIKKMKVDVAVEAVLTSSGAINAKAVVPFLKGLDKAELADDGTIKGLAEQIEALTKADDTKFLFATKKQTQVKGAKPGESGNEDGDHEVDTSKMTYSELAAYMVEHPNVKID